MTAQQIFDRDRQFFRLSVDAAQELAMSEQDLDLYFRIMMFAFSHSNGIGHTAYGNGVLRRLLAKLDHETGEYRPPDRRSITRAIEKLTVLGVLEPESNARCLVVAPQWGSNGASTVTRCRYHGLGPGGRPVATRPAA